jgi:hypothetical protein
MLNNNLIPLLVNVETNTPPKSIVIQSEAIAYHEKINPIDTAINANPWPAGGKIYLPENCQIDPFPELPKNEAALAVFKPSDSCRTPVRRTPVASHSLAIDDAAASPPAITSETSHFEDIPPEEVNIMPLSNDAKSEMSVTPNIAPLRAKATEYPLANYNALFKYISKNRSLTDAIGRLSMATPGVQNLLTAIQEADFHASVYCDDRVDLYLLYLMKEGKLHFDSDLNFWSGITNYLYITALRAHTEQLTEIPGESNVRDSEIATSALVLDGKFTEMGESYLIALEDNLRHYHCDLSIDNLKQFILDLPKSEQSLLHGEAFECYSYEIFSGNLPFFRLPTGRFCLPSLSVINYFLKTISSDPIQLMPIFGKIGLKTLAKMHEKSVHPLPLSSLLVKSNMLMAHDIEDTFFVAIHDIGHAFFGSFLKSSARAFNAKLIQLLEPKEAPIMTAEIEKFLEIANDYDLTPVDEYIQNFQSQDERVLNYFNTCFKKSSMDEKSKMRLLALFIVELNNNDNSEGDKEIYLHLLHSMSNEYKITNDKQLIYLLFLVNSKINTSEILKNVKTKETNGILKLNARYERSRNKPKSLEECEDYLKKTFSESFVAYLSAKL